MYSKGDFQTYRAITKIHLGALSDNLAEGEEVEFDGFTMRRGGDEHALHSLRGAIKVGWLVPHEAPETSYVPKPAGIVVHKADGVSEGEVAFSTVSEEDTSMGTLAEVRQEGAPPTHKAKSAGEAHGAEGVVVGKFTTPAKQGAVQVGKEDRQVVKSLDNKAHVDVERVAVAKATATGDVDEAIEGSDLEELLPEAASTGRPAAGVSGEGAGDESVARARQAVSANPLDVINQFIPGFEWDTSVQWAKRAKIAVEKYGHIPMVMDYITSVETAAVKKEIAKRMGDG